MNALFSQSYFKRYLKSINVIIFENSFLTKSFAPLKSSLALMTVLLFFQAALTAVLPLFIREAIDNISNFEIVWKAILASVFVGTIILVFDYLEEMFHAKHIVAFQISLREKLVKKILNCKHSFLQTKKSINLVHNVGVDTRNLDLCVRDFWVILAKSVPTILILLGVILWVNFYVGCTLISFFFFYFMRTKRLTKKMRFLEKNLIDQQQEFQGLSLQILDFIPVMKSLSLENKIDKIIQRQLMNYDNSMKKQGFGIVKINLSINSVKTLSRPFVLLVGVYAIYLDKISLGDLFLIMSYLELIQKPLYDISTFLSRFAKSIASYERIKSLVTLMDNSQEERERKSNLQFESQDIVFKNVVLEFESARIPQRESLNLKFSKGKFYQIRGESGIGKSSFFKLLNGLLEPTAGEISYGGLSYKKIPIKNLRDEVRLIMQDDLLLPMSILENVALDWESEPNEQEVWNCLKMVNAESFVRSLPQGLDTKIGNGGVPISGGERKRLNLARGLYGAKKVKVFAFDEPTAGLDPESSLIVHNNLRLMAKQGKTVFCITHKNKEFDNKGSFLVFTRKGVSITENDDRGFDD